jgi:hypothetical protein
LKEETKYPPVTINRERFMVGEEKAFSVEKKKLHNQKIHCLETVSGPYTA